MQIRLCETRSAAVKNNKKRQIEMTSLEEEGANQHAVV